MLSIALGSAAAAYACYIGGAYCLRSRVIYPLAGTPYGAFREWPGEAASRLTREIPGGRVHAFHLETARPRGRVVLLHGNMMVASDVAFLAGVWLKQGFDVLVPEYRGYASATGRPDTDGIVEDTLHFLDRMRPAPDKLIVHGISLGGGIAAELTRSRPIDALVMQSTFLSISVAAARYGLPGVLVRNLYPTERTLQTFEGRALVVHGDADPRFPPRHGRRLATLLPRHRSRYVEVPGAVHMIDDRIVAKLIADHADWLADGEGGREDVRAETDGSPSGLSSQQTPPISGP
ncbi:alpha/beta hydrolase [Chelativorans salis]|uniref:Alpha/beta hydrolase n=1 Tax=Chelativorans salis TaxID=2978478 RepID=A0ABT2LJ04_9HYPH|nr:alpha/beta hydrolase [Chelativorans sp. EGI FJ00035]MCT7373663.1 alpha/beta hydrolase [Chelativorans sp. EGI FJ00035]